MAKTRRRNRPLTEAEYDGLLDRLDRGGEITFTEALDMASTDTQNLLDSLPERADEVTDQDLADWCDDLTRLREVLDALGRDFARQAR